MPIRRRLTLLLGAAVLATGFALPASAEDDVPLTLTVSADLHGNRLTVSGRATVPDGAFVIYGIYRTSPPERRVVGYARVGNERYAADADVSAWPSGEIAVDVHFQTLMPGETQPDAVLERFGEKGQRMTGHQVVQGGEGYRAAVVSTAVVKP